MNLQLRWDLYHAQRDENKALKQIKKLKLSLPPSAVASCQSAMPNSCR